MNVVSMQRVGIAILSITLISAVIVVEIMVVMRMPELRILVRMYLDHRDAR